VFIKVFDIALKDLVRSLRSMIMLVFMFGIPLLVSSMFYMMFGSAVNSGGFNLARVKVVVANMDSGGPRLQLRGRNVPGNLEANTMGELVVKVLQSEDLSDLIDARQVDDAAAAIAAVDNQASQVAVIIPVNFSRQFADQDQQAVIQLYKDPTLQISPGIVKAIMNQFMDGIAGIKITADLARKEAEKGDPYLAGIVIQRYLQDYLAQDDDLSASMLDIVNPMQKQVKEDNPMISIVGAILVGFMIFFAFYTGTAASESILREEEERTLPRLFTTPTSQMEILGGKYLSVFLILLVQIGTLMAIAPALFGIMWGDPAAVCIMGAGIVVSASSTGIFINSLLKDTRQGGIVFGGVLTLTGMIGMMSVFTGGSDSNNFASLLVPQGWAVRGLFLSMRGASFVEVLPTALGLLLWGVVFFSIGFMRFKHRYI
jgi:ABC-2 type transport system permease protein